MAKLSSSNMFQSWELSHQEYLTGSILTTLQIQCIQNQIVQIAHEKTLLKFTPSDVLGYAQREAELQGKLISLQYLISLSEEATRELDPGLVEKQFNMSSRETPPDEKGSLFPPLVPTTARPPASDNSES